VAPTLVIDEDATEQARAIARASVEPQLQTVFHNQVIVSKGERFDATAVEMLEEVGLHSPRIEKSVRGTFIYYSLNYCPDRPKRLQYPCMKKRFLVLDGNALLHRAWHAIPPLTTKDGRVVNAAYGFTMIVEKMRDQFKPDYMAVAWDLPGPTFRHKEYKEYKATREKKEQELYDQIPIIQDILDAYDIPSLSAESMEADDVIGTLAKKYGAKKDIEVLILTGDLDTLQLVNKDVKVVAFVKGVSETKEYDVKAVKERYGLRPDQMVDFKALMGDPSDNIPGVAGVGKKTAAELLKKYDTVEGIYEAIEAGKVPEKFAKKFAGQEEQVEKMKHLIQLVQDVDLEGFKITDAKTQEPDVESLVDLFRELGFRRLVRKYGEEIKEIKETKEAKDKDKVRIVDLKKLGSDSIAVYVDLGQQDLFGGALRSITLYDGKQAVLIENPKQDEIRAVLKHLAGCKLIIGHDLKSVFHVLNLQPTTYKLPPLSDTMVGAYLLAPGTRNFDLATVAYDQVGVVIKETTETTEKAALIFDLYKKIEKGLEKEGTDKVAREIEMPLIPILYEMERTGVQVDPKHLEELSKEFGQALDKLTNKILKLAGREFNINSPIQLAEVLFEDLKLPTKGIKKTKTGYSTAASELVKLWEAHKIIPLISEYRGLAKLKSTYIDALPELLAEDGRIHTTYNQTVTATGRLSSSDPNLQNIPIRTKLGNEIRKAFVAGRGKVLFAADYSQFELRLAAHIARDKSFIKAFKEGADIHLRTAAEVLGKEEKAVTKAERRAAKTINFGILYGMGPRNLARATGFSQEEARNFIERYFEVHPGIRQYIDEIKIKAHADEYVETLFSRRRYLPDINSGIQMLVAAAERMAVNMPIQGTQADLMKMAMIDVQRWIEDHDYDVKMLLQVHDELVFEVAQKDLDRVVPPIRDLMAAVHTFDVPLVVNCEVGKNWGVLKAWK
ncbi:DNA polymerase I, partial [Patescibacteria group bacterium]|nr:DNA polymerase I [Patescibacteria group bacterium]